MIRFLSVLVLGVAVCAFNAPAKCAAADKDEVKAEKVEGVVQCGKCHLKLTDKCAAAIVSKGKDGKDRVLFFDADAHKKYHDDICQEKKPGTVTGTVKKDGDKFVITVKELKFK